MERDPNKYTHFTPPCTCDHNSLMERDPNKYTYFTPHVIVIIAASNAKGPKEGTYSTAPSPSLSTSLWDPLLFTPVTVLILVEFLLFWNLELLFCDFIAMCCSGEQKQQQQKTTIMVNRSTDCIPCKFMDLESCCADGREDQTVVSEFFGSLLRDRSMLPYFMLVAFEACGILRYSLLLFFSPVYYFLNYCVSESSAIRLLIWSFSLSRDLKSERLNRGTRYSAQVLLWRCPPGCMASVFLVRYTVHAHRGNTHHGGMLCKRVPGSLCSDRDRDSSHQERASYWLRQSSWTSAAHRETWCTQRRMEGQECTGCRPWSLQRRLCLPSSLQGSQPSYIFCTILSQNAAIIVHANDGLAASQGQGMGTDEWVLVVWSRKATSPLQTRQRWSRHWEKRSSPKQ